MANTKITNHIVDKTFITGQTAVTAADGDYILVSDASDSGALKKVLASDLIQTNEEVQDLIGAMFSSNTETGIAATYQDGDGTIDLVLDAAQTTITSLGTLTALTVDNMAFNGNTLTTTSSDYIIDASHDIVLDAGGGDIVLKEGGTTFGQFSISSGDLFIQQPTADKDIVLRGLDDSTYVAALTLDMSNAGAAIFNAGISANNASTITVTQGNHVNGLKLINSQAGGFGSALTFQSERSDNNAIVSAAQIRTQGQDSWNSEASADSNLIFATSLNGSLTDYIYLKHDGAVGIKKSAPGADLHIAGTQNRTFILERNNGSEAVNLAEMLTHQAFTIFNKSSGSFLNFAGNATHTSIQAQSDGSTAEDLTLNPYGGNVGIGTTTPAQAFEIFRNSNSGSAGGYAGISLRNDHSGGFMACQFHEGGTLRGDILFQNGVDDMQFRVGGGGAERMRIVSNGEVRVGTTQDYDAIFTAFESRSDHASITAEVTHASYAGDGIVSSSSRNTSNASYRLFQGQRRGNAVVFTVNDAGNTQNINNSFTGISDERLKINIEDAKSQWDDIKALRVRNYEWGHGNTGHKQIGLVSQEVEAAGMTHLIEESPADEYQIAYNSDLEGENVKTMKYSVLYMKAVKALQEAINRIETLETKVQNLEG